MKTTINKLGIILFTMVLTIGLTSCDATRNANNKQKGASIGTPGGAILDAINGNKEGKCANGEFGRVIGVDVGGTDGVTIGNKMDKQEQKIEEEEAGDQGESVDDGIVVHFDEKSGV